jgi:hypothetical protein
MRSLPDHFDEDMKLLRTELRAEFDVKFTPVRWGLWITAPDVATQLVNTFFG